ncbi:protein DETOXIFICATION 16-like isoform X2 [Phoenix dactylifera]|uniref:Protein DETOXIFICATION n=1 Tax=Phoenix dactylifera TaxID=42345 RepID=A0A8B9AKL5_PHODC|nr:protein DETOXIFICATION 16-like isoform X2 [Phoenix dactylifera]
MTTNSLFQRQRCHRSRKWEPDLKSKEMPKNIYSKPRLRHLLKNFLAYHLFGHIKPPSYLTCMSICGRPSLSLLIYPISLAKGGEEEMEKPSVESPLLLSSEKGGGEVLAEVKKQLWLAGPLIATNLLQKSLQMISVMFVGHLGELALSGASMATSFAGVTGFSLLLGMSSALDTLCGQAFGARSYRMLGIHMQRAMLVLMLTSIPLAAVWAYTGQILMLCGQDRAIATEAGVYARWMIPSLFAYGLIQCHVRFLQTQNIVFPMMLASGFAALLHILVCWILVFKSGLGSRGAALANSFSYWLNALLLALFVKLSPDCKKTWTGFSKEALHDIINFIRLAVPSAVMLCLNTVSMTFMVPLGFGAAVSTRVSNELGAGRPQAARLAVRVVVFMAIAQGLVVGSTMVFVRKLWGYAYSNEEEVVNYVAVMLPILAASNIMDGVQCVLSGVARGCGWQKIGALVNLGAYNLVGIPSAILLAFVLHVGGKGLWMGIICGVTVQALLLSTITLCTNWEKEARKARDRVYNSTIPIDMET